MKKVSLIGNNKPAFKFSLLPFFIVFLSFSCAHQKVTPKDPSEVGTSLPANVSEIREIKHIGKGEVSHEALELTGQVFIKNTVSDSLQLTPCDSCNIKMHPSNDTTTMINLKTDRTGQFEFTGKKDTYTIYIKDNPGLDQIEVYNVDLSIGGHNNIIINLARGNKLEKYYVTRKDKEFTWSPNAKP
jgi:hypothetical protein